MRPIGADCWLSVGCRNWEMDEVCLCPLEVIAEGLSTSPR